MELEMPQDNISLAELKTDPLLELIQTKIHTSSGALKFSDFMQLALYAPSYGYYSKPTPKFGASGDFITAPELGNLFAKCLAKQCSEIFHYMPNSDLDILEIGAGSGQLACDLLVNLQLLKIEIKNYFILELSAGLRLQQQQKIKTKCPDLYSKVTWLEQLPLTKITGIIIANEVLDAMPVSKFQWYDNCLQEVYVTQSLDNSFEYVLKKPSESLQHYFDAKQLANCIGTLDLPYISEANLWGAPWIASLSRTLQHGAILLFDYGFSRNEYYHPQRSTGTLMCHYKHLSHSDPLINVGSQDITAHVDFTSIAEAASENKLTVAGYTNLAYFLINCGIADFCEHTLQHNQEIQILTSPAEMGELFKAMALTKNLHVSLLGFNQFDKLYTL
jgi:SAM-dependent MidA family methyltransferase